MDTWILRMIRRAYTRQLAAWGVLTLAGILVALGNARYIENFARGPFAVTAADLEREGDVTAAPRYFVRVHGDTVIDTGLQEITVKTENGAEVGRSVSAGYYALHVGDRFLIVKSSAESSPGTDAAGALEPISPDLDENLFDTPEKQQFRSRVYPFYLDAASSFRTGGFWGLGIGIAFLALLFWRARIGWQRLQHPEEHPVAVRVARWGNAVTTSAEIERELAGTDRGKLGGWVVTPRYLVRRGWFTFNVLRFHDLLWAYKRVTKRSVNLIPAGKYYTAVLFCYGGSAQMKGSQKKVDAMLQLAGERAPWAVLGHSPELLHLWSKKNAEFCAGVEARRAKLAAAG